MIRKIFYHILVIAILYAEFPCTVYAHTETDKLYAQSAVLMDADSGRILYGKNQEQELANASTTKILTCIIALEEGDLDDAVTISDYAATQPKVHLGTKSGEMYVLKDLLYSLMLESHNDSAVAIAEYVSGNVEAFSKKMNQKLLKIGCNNSYFITPNGLDSSNEVDKHHTTATDLAKIMRYCIKRSDKKEEFLEITGTQVYSFTDLNEKRRFTCNNHNALLTSMEGVLSGKTGFTNDAGYCYVGALKKDGKTLIVALLACGWPNHKNYKWEDSRKLFAYGIQNYQLKYIKDFPKEGATAQVIVTGGRKKEAVVEEKKKNLTHVLVGKQESYIVKSIMIKAVDAPVEKNQIIGVKLYMVNGKTVFLSPIYCKKAIEKRWMLLKMQQNKSKCIENV